MSRIIRSISSLFMELLSVNKYVINNAYSRWKCPVIGHPTESDILNQEAVFVISTGRAGTKFVTNILTKKSDFSVHHDLSPKLEYASFLLHKEGCKKESSKIAFLASRMSILSETFRMNKKYIETNNRISLFAEGIAELMPNSKFIHLVRHPAEFVRSGIRRGYYETMDPALSGHIMPSDEHNIDWDNMTQLEKVAWQWSEINYRIEIMKSRIESKGGGRVRTYRSDMIFSDMAVLQDLLKFIGWDELEYIWLEKIMRKPANIQINGECPVYGDWTIAMKKQLLKYVEKHNVYGFEL